eukprot:15482850-Alexandrium_andersonii.AAC.1
MRNLPAKPAGGRARGASRGGPGAEPPREALCYATGYRSNRVDRRNRTRRRPNRPNRVPPCPGSKHAKSLEEFEA